MIQAFLLLFAGSGQGVLAAAVTHSVPSRLFFLPFALPCLVFFTLHFFQESPFTFEQHFKIAFGTLFLWSAATLVIEVCLLFAGGNGFSRAQMVFGQVAMNLGWLAFIPTWLSYRACVRAREPLSDATPTRPPSDLQSRPPQDGA
jgi:hypothetical protein